MKTVIVSFAPMWILPSSRLRRAATYAGAVAILTTAGCGGGADGGGSNRVTVVATTGVLAEIADAVAGEDAEVVQLIPDGVDVHGFEASAQDRATLEAAAVVVANGAGLEEGIPLDDVEARRWSLADSAGDLRELDGRADPHVWLDPTRLAAAVPSLADALAEADPGNARAYGRRAEDYVDRLEELDSELADELSAIPGGRRSLVTSHDALGYFADRYDLEVIATPFPSSGPEAEPSAARLAEVRDAIRESGVPAVFAQASDDPEVLEVVAREPGVEVMADLLVSSPGDAGGYEEMMRRNAMVIAAALG